MRHISLVGGKKLTYGPRKNDHGQTGIGWDLYADGSLLATGWSREEGSMLKAINKYIERNTFGRLRRKHFADTAITGGVFNPKTPRRGEV